MIIATLLMRDEEEIVRENIEHHLAQGIEKFIVTLHRSRDGTREILREFPQVAQVIEVEDEAYNQCSWVTHMAQEACRFRPSWIVHLDADEFWEGFEWLRGVPRDVGLVTVTEAYEHRPTEGMVFGQFRREQMPDFKRAPHHKVIHRPTTGIRIRQGNHGAHGHRGRSATTDQIHIHHYPVRSYGHFEQKVIQGGQAYAASPKLPVGWGWHWRQWYALWEKEPAALRKVYESAMLRNESDAKAESVGRVTSGRGTHRKPSHVEYVVPSMYPPEHFERTQHEERYREAGEFAVGVVADAACGFGYGSDMLSKAPRVSRVIGYDRNETALWNAQQAYPHCTFLVADLDAAPPADCHTLVTIESIEHLKDPLRFMETMKQRVARRIFLTTPIIPTTDWNPWHKHDFTVESVRAMFDGWNRLFERVVNGTYIHTAYERRASRIPRVFHRIWLGDSPMPEEFVRYGQTWLDLHPGWESILWTEKNRFRLENEECFVRTTTFTEKSDLMRHEILLKFGGVYVDTDVEALRSMEPLIGDVDAFAAFESADLIGTAILGCVPGHRAFRESVSALGRPPFPRSPHANLNTGPVPVTNAWRMTGADREVKLFPTQMFYPWPFGVPRTFDDPRQAFPDAYAIHYWAHSWK